jgi:hypothetical protein
MGGPDRCGYHDGVRCGERNGQQANSFRGKVILTVAHLDHNPANCDPGNLLAMCQACHLRYDGRSVRVSRFRSRGSATAWPHHMDLTRYRLWAPRHDYAEEARVHDLGRCAWCGAGRGEPCRRKDGRPSPPHSRRRKYIAPEPQDGASEGSVGPIVPPPPPDGGVSGGGGG